MTMIVIGGKFSHAVIKKAKEGDFRVQDDHGGSVEQYTPNEAEIAFALSAMATSPQPAMFGRVDMIYDNNN
jgi:hypothetical protein